MKVLHLINTLSVGGAELHLLTLCRFLKARNVEIVVACLREKVVDSRSLRPDFERHGIRVIDLRADRRYDSRFLGRIAKVIRAEQPDIFHTHLPRADLAGALASLFVANVVWVCSVHAIYSHDWSGRWSLPLFDRLWRRADKIVCISNAVRDWLVGRGMPASKARVVYYGIEPEVFAKPPVDLRQQWDLTDGAIVGSIGRLEPRKGHEVLIQAMPELCRRVPNARLLIAGHDPWGYGKNLVQLIESLGLQQRVRLVGFQRDVISFLNALDVFAFASSSEGFGQVVVEAMAAEKPVVASKIAPLTEIVVDGETGLLVPPGEPAGFVAALQHLLGAPPERLRMGLGGRARVEQCFNATAMSEQMLSLYQELLSSRRQQRAAV